MCGLLCSNTGGAVVCGLSVCELNEEVCLLASAVPNVTKKCDKCARWYTDSIINNTLSKYGELIFV
jgi:hypothetical protein